MFKRKSDCYLRTKLEKCLLSSLIIVTILLAGSLSFLAIKLTVTPSQFCITPACISSANSLLNYIDPTSDPCDNFFQFSCGSYLKEHGSNHQESKQLKNRIKSDLDRLLKESIGEDDHYMVKNQKILFQLCMNNTDNKEDNLNYFKNVVEEVNGWPLLEGKNWKNISWEEVSHRLSRFGLHYSSILDIKIDSDPINVTNNIVVVSESFILPINDNHTDIRLKYMEDSISYLGGKNLKKKILEMYEFQKGLTNISLKNDYKFDNVTEEIMMRRFTVKDFQKQNNQINWLNFINNFLSPVASITENDYVIFPVQEYVDSFFDLINTTPNRVIVNYIIWNLFDSLTHFFRKELENLEKHYRFSVEGHLAKFKIFDHCKLMLGPSFGASAPTDMVYAKKILSSKRKTQIEEMIKYIKSEFKKMLLETTWMDQLSKEKSLEKLEGIVEVLGSKDYFEDPLLELFSNRTLDESDTFMISYIKSRKLYVDMQHALLQFPGDYNKFRAVNKEPNIVNAHYMPDRNMIALFTGILQNMYFDPKQSNFLNYANLGTVIGHELTHGFSKCGSEYDKVGNRAIMWTDITSEAFNNVTQCVLKESDSFEIFGKKMNATKTLEENIADFSGVKVAYRAYNKWVQEHGEESPLVGMSYTPYQLFWISSAVNYCYEIEKSDAENTIKYDVHAFSIFRVNAPLKNNADFARDFNCPIGSGMNPLKKCVVF